MIGLIPERLPRELCREHIEDGEEANKTASSTVPRRAIRDAAAMAAILGAARVGAGGRVCRGVIALAICSALLAPAWAGETTFSVDAAAVQSFLRAVTPYDVTVGKGELNEKLTLANPRNVRFQDGRVFLTLDARGEPFPIEMVLTIAIGLKWDEEKKCWMAYLASLPLEIPLFGKFDLAKYVDPYPIPQTFSQPAGNDEVPFTIDGLLKSLQVLDDRILVTADLTFRGMRPPEVIRPAASPAAPQR